MQTTHTPSLARAWERPAGSGFDSSDAEEMAAEPPLLSFEQALALWERKHVAPLMLEGWTREQVDTGCRPLPGGRATRRPFRRPGSYLPPKAGEVRTEANWFYA